MDILPLLTSPSDIPLYFRPATPLLLPVEKVSRLFRDELRGESAQTQVRWYGVTDSGIVEDVSPSGKLLLEQELIGGEIDMQQRIAGLAAPHLNIQGSSGIMGNHK